MVSLAGVTGGSAWAWGLALAGAQSARNAATFSPPLLIAGLLLALLGWVLYWGGLTALGALIGAAFGSGAGLLVAHIAEWSSAMALASMISGGIAGAIVGILGLRFAHAIVFFLGGVALGSVVSHLAWEHLQPFGWEWLQGDSSEILFRASGALIGGLLLAVLDRMIIISITTTLGTLLIVSSWPAAWMIIASPVIWAGSFVAQTLVARRMRLVGRGKSTPARRTKPSRGDSE